MKNQIQLKTIKFKNIFSYGNKWNTFDFKTGISFITGKNLSTNRRNFTGKSSFLKIIPFALFGKVEGVNKSQIINWKNKKQTEVILTFDKNGSEYIIHRGIKPDIFNVIKDGSEIPQSSNKTKFQQEIEDTVLQMDFTTFMNIVYCDTNNSASILNASKPVKRAYIEKLFNLSYFTNLKDIANVKKKSINTKTIKAESAGISASNKIELSKQNITKYEYDIKGAEYDRVIINRDIVFVDETTKYPEKLKLVRLKQEAYEKDTAKKNILLEKIKSKIFYLSKFKVEREVSQKEIDLFEHSIAVCKNDIRDIGESIKKVDVYNLDACTEEAKIELDETNGILRVNKFDVDNLSKEISKLDKELKSKPKDGKCPTCLQKVDFKHIKSEYKTIIKEKQNGIVVINKSIIGVEENITRLTIIYDEFITKRNNYDSLVNSLSVEKTKQVSYEEELKKLNTLLKKLNKVVRFQRAIGKLNTLNDKLNVEISTSPSFKEHIIVLEKKIEEHDRAYKEYLKKTEQLKGIDINIASIKGYISDTNKQVKLDLADFTVNTDKMKKLNNMLEYVKQVIVLCGDDKCKQYAISNFLPYFNERINYYLNKSGVLFYIKLSGWMDYDILGPGISNCSYDNLSGAERISLDRAIQLASMDIKKSQSSSLIDVLILDEVLDSSVDDIGLKDMMEIIKAKQIDDDSKVLIVSHRNELGSLNDMFDWRYLVRMDKYSTIVEV